MEIGTYGNVLIGYGRPNLSGNRISLPDLGDFFEIGPILSFLGYFR